MRFVKKNINEPPKGLSICGDKNEKVLLKNKKSGVRANCYKKSKKQLEILYENKCAYCEQSYQSSSYTQIEHYRPKSVYYWLAYEWSNLIPSCQLCNNKKRAHFPIIEQAKFVAKPSLDKNGKLIKDLCKANNSPLIDEKPYILHPEIDDPKKHLGFEINNKKQGIDIIAIDKIINNKSRGSETIRLLNLNREQLRLKRQEIINIFIKQTRITLKHAALLKLNEEKIINLLLINFEQLEADTKNTKYEHTLLRKYIFETKENFQKIVSPFFEKYLRKILILAFKKFKN